MSARCLSRLLVASAAAAASAMRVPQLRMQLGGLAMPPQLQSLTSPGSSKKKLLVIGGNGFVGREVCKYAVRSGAFTVTSLSRRGQCPSPNDEELSQVTWVAGNALDKATVGKYVGQADAVVHAIGLLFDVDSGIQILNTFTSASGSKPDEEGKDRSTYDNITRKSAITTIEAMRNKAMLPALVGQRMPFAFVSCAEAGWPDVQFGPQVDEAAPDWLKRYLVAKRAVEAELSASTGQLRSVIVRPSLIWNWKKFDVLPVIPVFNIASALGVPFIDKTVRVEDVGRSIVAGLLDESVSGVQRFEEMESLSAALDVPK